MIKDGIRETMIVASTEDMCKQNNVYFCEFIKQELIIDLNQIEPI